MLTYFIHHTCIQVGDSVFEHVSIPCNPAIVGSVAACFNQSIPSQGNLDYNLTDPKVRDYVWPSHAYATAVSRYNITIRSIRTMWL